MGRKTSVVKPLTLTKATYYKVPIGKKTSWIMAWVSNTDSQNEAFSLFYYNARDNEEVPIFDAFPITSKNFIDLGGEINEFIQMRENDEIRAFSTRASTLILGLNEEIDIIQGG